LVAPAAQRLASGLLLLSPNTPLLFMGEEYAETNPFAFFCSFEDPQLIQSVREGRKREFAELAFRWEGEVPDATLAETFNQARLSWRWADDPQRAGLRNLYQSLLAARKTWPPLVDRDHTHARVTSVDNEIPLLVTERGSENKLVAIANLTNEEVRLPIDFGGGRAVLLSTNERRFGGERSDVSTISELGGYELVVWGDAAWQ
jgi:maltooligosyltrehalose trehalohydrolase